MAVPFKVKALYEYTSGHEDDLPFDIGQIITVNDVDDPDWYGGEYVDASGQTIEGIFPRNFVEKYEPVAPPRPTRSKKKEAEPAAAPPPEPATEEPEPESQVEQESRVTSPPPPAAEPRSPKAPQVPAAKPIEPEPEPEPEFASVASPTSPAAKAPELPAAQPPAKAPAPARGGPPPPVSEKPSSFKDRIAAFNKPAAPPVAPFKPSALSAGGTGFVKKPFVAPPPSRNAYVPPPREAPVAKVYKRDEDPEIREREVEAAESAEKAGLSSSGPQEDQDEDQPKPTSLKDRIALLQKQQAEAASRHADALAKKEKPRRPTTKKRTESEERQEGLSPSVADAPTAVEQRDTDERSSMDEPAPRQLSHRRKSVKGPPEDGNEADMSGAGDTTEGPEELTEKEESDEKPKPLSRPPTAPSAEPEETEEDEATEEKAEEDDDVDPEARRKEELRARMAKMSGGMGFNMFGAPMPAPGIGGSVKKKKPAPGSDRRPSEQQEEPTSPIGAAPPVPTMMALPGMGQKKPKEEEEVAEPDEEESANGDDITPVPSMSPRGSARELPSTAPSAASPVPGGRPAPPPIPVESRPPPPPPPPAGPASPSLGSESDDEASESQMKPTIETSSRAPPPIPMASPPLPASPRSPGKRFPHAGEPTSPTTPATPPRPSSSRRSMPPPPIPGAAPPALSQNRPPPPPPGVPRRSSTLDREPPSPMRPGVLDNNAEENISEYEGDYDTDIASSAPHKEALKSHARGPSHEETRSIRSPLSDAPPPAMPPPPPIPSAAPPRAVPPPIPSQPPPTRASVDVPRAAPPPPPPPPQQGSFQEDDDEYDPFNYAAPGKGQAPGAPQTVTRQEVVASPEPSPSYHSPTTPGTRTPAGPSSKGASMRKSIDAQRTMAGTRRSMDVGRPSMSIESGYMASDVELAPNSKWWLQPGGLPPVFQGRKDIYSESDESSLLSGGRTLVTKEVYILFQDYSQTVVTARFDPKDPSEAQLDQRHEPPPRSLRQDELEQAHERFGLEISRAILSKSNTVVGDGAPQTLVYEMLKPFRDALLPVGTRGYGALVYANMANASTQTNDQIRPGDIISIRNAKFQGKHGPMHAKYSVEVGKPDHVAIVAEWDGTKKKVRAWEQGRESKKVKQESFKLDDLRSGEVKIWRIMPRSWIGWEAQR